MYEMTGRHIPYDPSWDVIVAGGGPAGCSAAIAAAREGARTLLIEASNCLGGTGTSALAPSWPAFSDGTRIIYRGLAQTIFEAAKHGMAHVDPADLDWVPIDAERLKRVYDALVAEAGVSVLFHTLLCAVESERDGAVSAVIAGNKAGLTAYRAGVYVDCTGDGDLAARAGAEWMQGDADGRMQPATLACILSNVDQYRYQDNTVVERNDADSPLHRILKSGNYPLIQDERICTSLIGPGTVAVSAGHLWDVDSTDPVSTSRAAMHGRKVAEQLARALAECHPAAFAGAHLVSTAPMLRIRESRRIVGDYVLTLDDYLGRRIFEDEICRNACEIDIIPTSKDIIADDAFERYDAGESHGIPYRCLTPQGLKNVLVAGRCISCEQPVQWSIRAMPVCLATGEAAGVAAAQSAQASDVDVHLLQVATLRQRLREVGAFFL